MVAGQDLISGRDALHRLDDLIQAMRNDFELAARSAELHGGRRTELVRLRAEAFRELAALRLDLLETGEEEAVSRAETEAMKLLERHDALLAQIDSEVTAGATAMAALEERRRAAESDVDAAVEAHESQVRATEARLETDAAYLALKTSFEDARAVSARAAQKLELAHTDRKEKGAPYEADPLFAYLWKRKFRTPEYAGSGLVRMLDGWVAKLCRYDAAWLNYARLIELPDRLSEHDARMKADAAEAERSIEAYEAAALEADGVRALRDRLEQARSALAGIDAELAQAEKQHAALRARQVRAASGEEGPQVEARALIEESLARTSFPDLRVLAAETTSRDDDRLVDLLIKLRTEELQLDADWRQVEALPARRRQAVEALEGVRRRFKQAGLDNPYVAIGRGAFEAAIEAYGRGAEPDGVRLWKAIVSTVRDAPRRDERYFGGRRRGDTIGLPRDDDDDWDDDDRGEGIGRAVGGVLGVVLDEVIRETARGGMRRGGWRGGGGPSGWGGGWGGGSRSNAPPRIGGGARRGGGGFKTGGRF